MDNQLYDYSPIIEREPIHWPDGARVAFYVGLNVEHYRIDRPATSAFADTVGLVPDPLNYGWRDYGPRVGVWRLIDSFDRHRIPVSALLNSDAAERYPQIIDAGRARDWVWLAHGKNNSTFQADMSLEEERAYLAEVVGTIERATGRRPRAAGWARPSPRPSTPRNCSPNSACRTYWTGPVTTSRTR
ncbi:hypothetical protein ACFU99_09780 [Streptomyces sp. NPDC057654]|uniref:hypothetical protein n=1 Tax=Streptomyces sp. NPDC057654 TaxID=3346196 RepID=UPI0036CDF48B